MKLIDLFRLLPAVCITGLLLTSATLRAADDTVAAPTTAALKSTELHFLKPGQPDAGILLAPPPLLDSPEQAAEMDEVRAVYHAASETDKQAAYGEKKFSVFNYTDAVGAFFVATNLPKAAAFFEKVQLDAETVTDLGKDYFKLRFRLAQFSTKPFEHKFLFSLFKRKVFISKNGKHPFQ